MTPDYDLSNLAYSEAKLWLNLHADAIRVRILLDQATHQASGDSRRRPASRARRKQRHEDRLDVQSASLDQISNLEALTYGALEPLSRATWPASHSSTFVLIPAVSRWMH
jgi:hypothetical protein